MEALKQAPNPPAMKLFDDPETQEKVWKVRESGLGATAHVPHKENTWPGWEDSAVPPEKVGDYLRDLRKLLDKYGYDCDLYGHFGQGCIHTRIDFDLESEAGVRTFHAFLNEAADLVVSYGGSLSGEHGDGQSRAELLPKMFGEELVQAFREFKSIWDPDGKMNPGKVVDAYLPTENLRLADYAPAQPETYFSYPEDKGRFGQVALRCVGVGNCRRQHSQTMCPSYRVTREEKHCTRGRARLLFEMLRGDVLTDRWQSEAVKESLDLCLACKGCKGDCPVHVDMATYKAEFLAHYYRYKLRPRQAYTFGRIDRWAALAAYAPGAVNWLAQAPGIGTLIKALAGVSPHRNLPHFAQQTFRHWFGQRAHGNPDDRPAVLLWLDTFNNHFHPETAQAAVSVLEAAGFQVRLPERQLCCGRPLYDFGMLDQAKNRLRQILADLRPAIEAGIPVVGLEPACVAVFRDELMNFFPEDEAAQKLNRQTYFFSEFLMKQAPEFRPPRLARKALLHGHCHQKALADITHEQALLEKLGLDWHCLDSGCCGMAGSFGFESHKADIAAQIGELVLLPAIRDAAPDTLIVADGYSCREQIAQLTERRGLHMAEIVRMALQRENR
jgi:Fe-S oxidoreductase